MPVPRTSNSHQGYRLSPLACLSLLFGLALCPLFARGPDPPRRILLDPLGFHPISSQFLLSGGSMITLDYVDDAHLLITFNVHRLMPRLPDDPEDDQDRNVDALLLELPSGHILARTSWRLHDHAQYLWNIGQGRFLLRVRDTLTVFAPLANLAAGEPFRERPFLSAAGRHIAEIAVSPDNSLLTVETVKRTPPAPRPKTPLFGAAPAPPPPQFVSVQINFYRFPDFSNTTDSVRPRFAGVFRTNLTGIIPALSAGYLAVLDLGDQRHWAFDFDSYNGQKKELAPFDSTCRPSPFFVSRSEFIAFGCHSGNNRQILGSFNMQGEETWEQNLFGDYVAPSLSVALSRDRFALSRILVHSSTGPEQLVVPEQIGAQTVVVYQTGSGRQILHAECSPSEPAGQNFSLSPDGLNLALIRDGAIEIYSLPELNRKETDDLKLATAAAPEDTGLPVHFSAAETSAAVADVGADSGADSVESTTAIDSLTPNRVPASERASRVSSPNQSAPGNTEGDAPPNQPRPRPTLYTLPSDPPRAAGSGPPQ